MLIVISGPPGIGKTAVAAGLATRLSAVHLSVDTIEDAIIGAGLARGWEVGVAAYEATRAAAEQNLVLGRVVVVDAVNDSNAARQTWRDAANHTAAALSFVMLNCSSVDEHRRRLEGRRRSLPNIPEPSWEQVLARASAYEPWTDDCAFVDNHQPLDTVINEIHRHLAHRA